MRLNAKIVEDYIKGKSITKYKEQWFYQMTGCEFINPSYQESHRQDVRWLYEQVCLGIVEFVPQNERIWEILFDGFKDTLENILINLIIGFPEPMDAKVAKNPEGKMEVLLDLGLWVKYKEYDILKIIHNLLTHELCHICIGERIKGIDEDAESMDYQKNLDANTFHEAFAHLLSYQDMPIQEVNWNSKEHREIWKNNIEKMKKALYEEDRTKQMLFLQHGFCGKFQEKFACICGMFHLADCWEHGGTDALKREFAAGYSGFAKKTIQGR